MAKAFRGVGKSWITSAYACWRLLKTPQINILVISASKPRADEFSIFTKRLISEIPVLQHLRPRPGQRDSNISFDVAPAEADHAPSVKSTGVTGQITGSRADLVIADDVEVVNNSETQLKREKLSDLVKEFDAVLKPDGQIVYLGTDQSEETLYSKLPSRGYAMRIWPARYPTDKQRDGYGGMLSPMLQDDLDRGVAKPGQPTDPKRFSDEDLLEREASYGKSGFALQFMLDTTLADLDRYPLKISDLCVMDLDPEVAPNRVVWSSAPHHIIQDLPVVALAGDRYYRPFHASQELSPYTGIVMAVDPSGRGKDRTGYAVLGLLHSQLFLLDAGGYSDGFSLSTLTKLSKVAARYKVNRIVVEENYGGGMFVELWKPVLRAHHAVTIEEVRSVGQKELRICDVLEPVLNSHKLVVDQRLIRRDHDMNPELYRQLFYQLTRITRDRGALRHDDELDALAMAVQYWSTQLAANVDEQIATRESELLNQQLQEFLNTIDRKEGRAKPRWTAASVLKENF